MLNHRRLLISGLAAACLPVRAQDPAAATKYPVLSPQPSLQAVLAGSHRSAAQRARDSARHPAETLAFFGVEARHTVIELSPGGGWYTEILAPWLRDQGQYWAAHFARDDPRAGARKAREAFEAKLAANPALYGPVRVGTLGSGPRFADLNPTGGADRVLTFRNVHNWLAAGHLDATLQACFAALKPGGVLGVVEHRAAPGTPIERMKDSGYIAEAFMIERAQAAGFELAERSEVNANPRDTRDHAKGVWALPPTLAGGEVDREKYLAIGESDRFTHRYRKPG